MANEKNVNKQLHRHAGPINLAPHVQHGLRALLRLAINGGYMKLREVVNKENIAPMDLENILSLLQESELVKSKEGTTESYALAKKPEEINLKAIIEAMQGNMNLALCIEGECDRINMCRSAFVFKALDKIMKEKFKEITLADLIKNYEDKS